jgi:hypothetical protein
MASSLTASPGLARSSSAPSGAPRDGTRKGRRCATRAPSATRQPSRALPGRTPTRYRASWPNASSARPQDAPSSAPRAVLGDGAKWIWNIASEYFPDAIQIVDRSHARQHLSLAARSIHGPGSDLGRLWAHQRYDELDAGNIEAVLYALPVHSPQDEDARKCVQYIDGNRKRMRYKEFRAVGLCTCTGVVEAGCKNAIGTRCKRPGMHWTVAGADAIIALRCCKLSGRFEDFWARRSARRPRAA